MIRLTTRATTTVSGATQSNRVNEPPSRRSAGVSCRVVAVISPPLDRCGLFQIQYVSLCGPDAPLACIARAAAGGLGSRGLREKGNLNLHPDVEVDREGRAPLLVRTPIQITIDEHAPRGGSFMKLRRLFVAAVSLSMGLAGVHGGALAQIKDAP